MDGATAATHTDAIANAAQLTPQGTGGRQRSRTREVEEVEELLEAPTAVRIELEAALSETAAALTAAQLELQLVQLGEDADETLSISSEGSRPSLDGLDDIEGMDNEGMVAWTT